MFAICDSVIENAIKNYEILVDVLFRFPQDNPHKVYIDNKDIVKKRYEVYTNHEQIRCWLDQMLKRSDYSFEIISIDDFLELDKCGKGVFIEICSRAFDSKNIITSNKQNYIQFRNKIDLNNINILTLQEAKDRLKEKETSSSTVFKFGNENQVSIGDNVVNNKN
jgi:hypothetical protein